MPWFRNKKKKIFFLKVLILSLIGAVVALVLVFGWRIYKKNMNLPIGIETGDDIWKVPIEDRDFLSIFYVVLKDGKSKLT
jgi:hypothetical protein